MLGIGYVILLWHSLSFPYNYFSKERFLFSNAITAAGVVPCGGPKKYPRISFIVQIIIYDEMEYSENSEFSIISRTIF